jgi:geranylgeranylglycerol-phosphate geranylgeranyltransferase
MTSIAVLVGVLAVSFNIPLSKTLLATSAAFLIAGASFAVNDLADQGPDRDSARPNPIVDNRVTANQAAVIAIAFSLTGFVISWLTNSPITIILAAISGLLAYIYSAYLKPYHSTIGHLATSYSTGITFVFGWSIFNGQNLVTFSMVFIMFAVTMTANVSRELIKTIADKEGDSKWGIRTLAVTKGEKFAARTALVLIAVAILLSYLPAVTGLFGSAYLLPVTLTNILLFCLAVTVCLDPSASVASHVKNDILYAMSIGILAFLVGPHFDYAAPIAIGFEILSVIAFVAVASRSPVRNLSRYIRL